MNALIIMMAGFTSLQFENHKLHCSHWNKMFEDVNSFALIVVGFSSHLGRNFQHNCERFRIIDFLWLGLRLFKDFNVAYTSETWKSCEKRRPSLYISNPLLFQPQCLWLRAYVWMFRQKEVCHPQLKTTGNLVMKS